MSEGGAEANEAEPASSSTESRVNRLHERAESGSPAILFTSASNQNRSQMLARSVSRKMT